jgi:hypothetical protein
MTAVRAVKAGKSLSEITAPVEFFNDLDGLGAERPMSFPVGGFVLGLKFIPSVVDDLPKR